VTHERVSPLHPLASLDRPAPGPQHSCPTDVSVSVVYRGSQPGMPSSARIRATSMVGAWPC
jgi:hypothetical protein